MKIDYGWPIMIGIVIVLAIFWKPITGAFANITGGTARKEQIARGKVIFYDTERWEGKGSYKSCAMCHAADFKPEEGKKITMPDYKPGEPYLLEGMRRKYSGALTGDDKLFQEI